MLKSAVAFEILSYLMDHPDAQETKEGIVEWWQLHHRDEAVEEALSKLVEKRCLDEFRGPDGRLHYRIAPSMRDGPRMDEPCSACRR